MQAGGGWGVEWRKQGVVVRAEEENLKQTRH